MGIVSYPVLVPLATLAKPFSPDSGATTPNRAKPSAVALLNDQIRTFDPFQRP